MYGSLDKLEGDPLVGIDLTAGCGQKGAMVAEVRQDPADDLADRVYLLRQADGGCRLMDSRGILRALQRQGGSVAGRSLQARSGCLQERIWAQQAVPRRRLRRHLVRVAERGNLGREPRWRVVVPANACTRDP